MPLVLRRKCGQSIEITHEASGETIRVKLDRVRPQFPGVADLVILGDDGRKFRVERPERAERTAAELGRAEAELRADGAHGIPAPHSDA